LNGGAKQLINCLLVRPAEGQKHLLDVSIMALH